MKFEDKVKICLSEIYQFKDEIHDIKVRGDYIYFSVGADSSLSISNNDAALILKEIAWNKYKECIISGYAEFGGFAKLQTNKKEFNMMYSTFSESDMIIEAFYWLVTEGVKNDEKP